MKEKITNLSNYDEYKKKIKKLQNYFWILQDLLDELIRNKEDSDISASKISGMPKSQIIKTIDHVYLSKISRRENIEKKVAKLYLDKKKIEDSIDKLCDPQERYVLKHKYLFFQTFEEISITLNKSYKQITRWHASAINNLILEES